MQKSGEVVIDLTFRCDMCRKGASNDGGRAQLDETDDDSPSEFQQQLDEQATTTTTVGTCAEGEGEGNG